jgi:hypothetical protein
MKSGNIRKLPLNFVLSAELRGWCLTNTINILEKIIDD